MASHLNKGVRGVHILFWYSLLTSIEWQVLDKYTHVIAAL